MSEGYCQISYVKPSPTFRSSYLLLLDDWMQARRSSNNKTGEEMILEQRHMIRDLKLCRGGTTDRRTRRLRLTYEPRRNYQLQGFFIGIMKAEIGCHQWDPSIIGIYAIKVLP